MSELPFLHRLAVRCAFVGLCVGCVGSAAAQPVIGPARQPPPRDQFIGRGGNLFSAGVRFASGVDVTITGSVGPLGRTSDIPPLQGGNVDRSYNDGFIGLDSNGNPNDTTQRWHIESTAQIDNGRVNYHLYSITSSSGFADEADAGGLGVDLQLGRAVWRIGNSIVLGVTGGFSVGTIDTKGSVETTVDLESLTDSYDLRGFNPGTAPISGSPSSVAIGSVILDRRTESMVGGGNVTSTWNLTGGHYNFRVGPAIYVRLSRRLSLQAAAGASAFYVASDFEYTDNLTTPTTSSVREIGLSSAEDWLTGYFAEGSVQWWFTDSAGIYAGASMHRADKLRQTATSRTATIDFGNTTQYTFGLNYNF